MRATTRVGLAARNMGVATDSPFTHEGTIPEVLMELAKWLATITMKYNVDLVLARTADEALQRLSKRVGDKTQKMQDEMKQFEDQMRNLGLDFTNLDVDSLNSLES